MMNLSCSLPLAPACHIILYHQHSPWIYICSFFSGSFIKLEAEKAQDIDLEELCFKLSTLLLNIHDDSRHVFMGFVDGKGGSQSRDTLEGDLVVGWVSCWETEIGSLMIVGWTTVAGWFRQLGRWESGGERNSSRVWFQKCWFLKTG